MQDHRLSRSRSLRTCAAAFAQPSRVLNELRDWYPDAFPYESATALHDALLDFYATSTYAQLKLDHAIMRAIKRSKRSSVASFSTITTVVIIDIQK